MISTFEIFGMVILAIVLGVVVWWFVVAEKYRVYLSDYSYTRGSNASANGQTLNLTCDADKEICVYRATQICTDPDSNNFENPGTDPIASGLSGNDKYGAYSSLTTVDRTGDLGSACNGKGTCSFVFNATQFPQGMNCGGQTQLLSTYACIPKGGVCQSYKQG